MFIVWLIGLGFYLIYLFAKVMVEGTVLLAKILMFLVIAVITLIRRPTPVTIVELKLEDVDAEPAPAEPEAEEEDIWTQDATGAWRKE